MKRSDTARAPVRGLGAVLPLLGWHFNFPGYMQDGMSCLAKDTFWRFQADFKSYLPLRKPLRIPWIISMYW